MVPATAVDASASTSLDDAEQPTMSTAMTIQTRITFERTVMCISVNLAERVIVITSLIELNIDSQPTHPHASLNGRELEGGSRPVIEGLLTALTVQVVDRYHPLSGPLPAMEKDQTTNPTLYRSRAQVLAHRAVHIPRYPRTQRPAIRTA